MQRFAAGCRLPDPSFRMFHRAYSQWIEDRENRLCFRTNNRVVRPFEWGSEWVSQWPTNGIVHLNGQGDREYLSAINRRAVEDSDAFFGYEAPHDFKLNDGRLTFRSAVETPHAENNTVHGQWFPARRKDGAHPRRAVLVLPHWNSHASQHLALCRGFQRFGISALRLSLPYHDWRMPPELTRADYAVSSNIGRTLQATRQAVIDSRSCVDWLESEGYERIGILGTSLGSCYAFLASAHDARLRVNVFNHCSAFFADVVWTGLSTVHIKQSLEGAITLEDLRDCWRAISPVHYLKKYAELPKKPHFIYTKYDTTFLPEFSEYIVNEIRGHGVDMNVSVLPCGHYTLGESPFKFIVGYKIVSHFLRHL
ncbi:MAG: alpha/beta hydrolase family protein [Bryobacterales bacterium]|nr:alpha/beta hydrolase family protein [Bryobacterales bacterium]